MTTFKENNQPFFLSKGINESVMNINNIRNLRSYVKMAVQNQFTSVL